MKVVHPNSMSTEVTCVSVSGYLSVNFITSPMASLVTQMVKNLPVMQKTQVPFLGQEYPLEKGMATHSSILAWIIPWTEELGRLQVHGVTKSQI